mgnify:CR=1 FL=1
MFKHVVPSPAAERPIRAADQPVRELPPGRVRLLQRVHSFVGLGGFVVLTVYGLAMAILGWLGSAWSTAVGVLTVAALLSWLATRRAVAELTVQFNHEDRLVRSVSHEIRRPVHRLLNAAERGLLGLASPEEALDQVQVQAVRLGDLFDDLLEAAQVMTGARALDPEPTDLRTVVDDAYAQLGVTKLRVVTVGEDVVLTVNPRLVRIAVTNLLRNAALHAYEGAEGTAVVELDARGLRVLDEGRGIPGDELRRIRQEASRSMRRSTAGIGLTLSTWVTDVHGGRLTVSNRPTGGVEVDLRLLPPPTP